MPLKINADAIIATPKRQLLDPPDSASQPIRSVQVC